MKTAARQAKRGMELLCCVEGNTVAGDLRFEEPQRHRDTEARFYSSSRSPNPLEKQIQNGHSKPLCRPLWLCASVAYSFRWARCRSPIVVPAIDGRKFASAATFH